MLIYTLTVSAWAQIATDGTLSPAKDLTGPDYQISADLGKQAGGNLFHSFSRFDIHKGESATFSGPDTVSNVISRVTGGNASHIDGVLRSEIPDANLYLLNPSGIMFGENAKLEVDGSFHASTADYLKLGADGEFHAKYPEQSKLSVASPGAFGFLGDNPGGITLQNSKLSVPEGETLSLIGGDLKMDGDPPVVVSNDGKRVEVNFGTELTAESGRINLTSITSPGEVSPANTGLDLDSETQGGEIIINNTGIDVNGEGGGSVFIRGGHFELISSWIVGHTEGQKDGQGINIQMHNIELKDSEITTDTNGAGKAGSISVIISGTLKISGINKIAERINGISSNSWNTGKAGEIEIEALRVEIKDGSQVNSSTRGPGEGNDITIRARESVNISGGLFVNTINVEDGGKGGNIIVYTDKLEISNEGKMQAGLG